MEVGGVTVHFGVGFDKAGGACAPFKSFLEGRCHVCKGVEFHKGVLSRDISKDLGGDHDRFEGDVRFLKCCNQCALFGGKMYGFDESYFGAVWLPDWAD